VVAVVVLVAVLSSGGGGSPVAQFGPGPSTTLSPVAPARGGGVSRHVAPFKPSPAALSLAASMPLARLVAQLFLIGPSGTAPAASDLAGPGWGGVVLDDTNYASDSQVASLAAGASSAVRGVGAPAPLLGATQEGGQFSAFSDLPPEGEAVLGASGQPGAARAQALLAGQKLRALGFDLTLAPLADVDTPGGPLSGRLFSSSPLTVASFSAAAIDGYRAAGVISAVGHFPGTGGASADPDQQTATVGGSLASLQARDLVPFGPVARSAPVIVMANAVYAAFDGVTPAGLLASAVSLLRRRYGFQGVVMSDDLDAALQATGGTAASAAVAAVRAGDDLLFITGTPAEQLAAYQGVLAAAQHDPAVAALVRAAVVRDLSLKARYGLLG
jgi:beta-N-acetylhexosaminidase